MNIEQQNDLKQLAIMYQTGRATQTFIAEYLGLSIRHVRRLLTRLTSSKRRVAWNGIGSDICAYLVREKQEHPNYNCQ